MTTGVQFAEVQRQPSGSFLPSCSGYLSMEMQAALELGRDPLQCLNAEDTLLVSLQTSQKTPASSAVGDESDRISAAVSVAQQHSSTSHRIDHRQSAETTSRAAEYSTRASAAACAQLGLQRLTLADQGHELPGAENTDSRQLAHVGSRTGAVMQGRPAVQRNEPGVYSHAGGAEICSLVRGMHVLQHAYAPASTM
jgi:hypothetical protein